MKVKFIRLVRDCKGRSILGRSTDAEPNPVRVEAHALGGVVPGFLVCYPDSNGNPGSIEFVPASNVERAQLEVEAPKKPSK